MKVVIFKPSYQTIARNTPLTPSTSFVKRQTFMLTTPYTQQQNGMSEKQNKFILEMKRCLLHEKNLPKKLWVEATNTTVFL